MKMNADQVRAAGRWMEQQSKPVSLQFPERVPDEAPATAAQLQLIRSLVKRIDEGLLGQLGAAQADALIEALQAETAAFTTEKAKEYFGSRQLRRSRRVRAWLFGCGFVFALTLLVLRLSVGSWPKVWLLFR